MGTFVLKQSVQAVLFKMGSVFFWIVCLVVAHTMADLSEASAAFSVSPSTLTYTTTVGGPNQAGSVTVTNTGSTALTVTWDDSINWLVAIQPGITQTIQPGQSGAFTLTASTAGLIAGTYSGTATISRGGIIKQVVPVTMTVASGNTTPAIGLSPTSLAFTGSIGGANPAARPITVSNIGSGTLSWSASENANWLTLSPQVGTNAGAINASVNLSGLAAGTYTGTVTVSGTGAATKTVLVTLTVTATGSSVFLNTNPALPSFTGTVGGSNPAPQTMALSSSGSALSWTATDNLAWLSLSQTSGSTPASLTMSVSTAGLAAGTYNGLIIFTAPNATNSPQYVPVTLTVTASTATPTIGLSPGSLSFSGTVGGANPSAQPITVSNTGGGTLSWSASDNANWLTLSPPTGTNAGTINASVNLSGLAAGTYTGTVTVSGTGAATKTVLVTLTITSGSTTPAIGLSPTSLVFTGSVGGANPAAQTISIANTDGGTLSWSASDNASWLTVSPASGSGTGTATAAVNTAGLVAGTLNATIIVAASGATTKSVPVTLTVTAPSTSAATLSWNASTSSDAAGYKVYKATASGAYGAPIATLQGSVLSYQAVGLLINTTYFFVVTSYDAAGNESLHSNEVSKSIF